MAVMLINDMTKLCQILGLPKSTTWFRLEAKADSIVTVECEYLPDECVDELEPILSRYELVLKEDPEDPE